MILAAFLTLLSHWRRHPFQLLAILVGLALSTGLWSAVQAINAEARASYASAAEKLGRTQADHLAPRAGQQITLTDYVRLRRSGWVLAPVLEGRIRFGEQAFDMIGVDLLNPPPLALLAGPPNAAAGTAGEDISVTLMPPGQIFLHPETATRIDPAAEAPPIVTSPDVPRDTVIADIALASRLLKTPDRLTRLVILPDQPAGRGSLSDIAPHLLQVSAAEAGTETERLTDSFHLNLTAFGLLSFAVGLFIVQGSVALGLEQRRGLLRTLRSLGVPLPALMFLLGAELALIALLAGTLGLGLGYGVAAALLPDVSATLSGLYGAKMDGSLTLRPAWVLSGLGMALGGTALAGVRAFHALWSMPILTAPAAGGRIWRAERSSTVMAVIGLVMALGAGLVIMWFDGLLAGFIFLGGVMLGAALVLPLCLALLLRLGARTASGPLADWLWADARAQLPGLSLALMALLLALAANVGVGTMVSSFRLTFVGWLDQRLAAEIYVTVETDAQGRDFTAWIKEQDGARALPIRWHDIRHKEAPLRIYGILDDPTYRDNWPILDALPGVWASVAEGRGVLINEQLARRDDYAPGDRLLLAGGWQMTIAGIYSDYGNPNAQAILALPLLLERADNVPNRQFGVRVAPNRATALIREVRARYGLPPERVADQFTIKAQSLNVFDRTFVITDALNILTLGVAAFAMLTSLLTLWGQRLPQLAPVWAMGVTRQHLARLDILRSLMLAALTACLALPLGLALAWTLLAVINVEAFGWRLPMYLFPWDWARLFFLALLAAALAALLPARRLARLSPSELLKVFANER